VEDVGAEYANTTAESLCMQMECINTVKVGKEKIVAPRVNTYAFIEPKRS
jgi:hypothetical protein